MLRHLRTERAAGDAQLRKTSEIDLEAARNHLGGGAQRRDRRDEVADSMLCNRIRPPRARSGCRRAGGAQQDLRRLVAAVHAAGDVLGRSAALDGIDDSASRRPEYMIAGAAALDIFGHQWPLWSQRFIHRLLA
jgi:hypothetical protein